VVALLALSAAWALTSGGGGGKNNAGGSDGKNPAPSTITPGPSSSGPAISQAPGGRDESGGGDSSGSGSGDGSGSGSGSGAGGAGVGGGGTGSVANSVGVGSGDTLADGSTMPDCTSNAVRLTVRSAHNAYEPGETPALYLTVTNSSRFDCKLDLGPKHAVVTITQAGGEDDYWSSADCPDTAGSLVFRIPADTNVTYTVKWDRKPSAPQCATPSAGSAGAGTYLVEAKAPGFTKAQTSFVLEND
jgi:hypothetical protein